MKISLGRTNLHELVRRFMSRETAEKAQRGLIEHYFNYCCPVWDGIGNQLSSKLQKLQNRSYDYRMHIRKLLKFSTGKVELAKITIITKAQSNPYA